MHLYIIRHAIAAQTPPQTKSGNPNDDSQRPLTKAGSEKMRQIARGLRNLEEQIDLILSSPYLRAVQTAHILAKTYELKNDRIILSEDLTPTGDQDSLINSINELYAGNTSIALVGHEPSLSRLISSLLSGDPTLPIIMKKGGVCRLSVETLRYDRCATLDWLLWPAQLVKIGG